MKISIKANATRWVSLALALAASIVALGCSSLSYVDPNPSQPYAFPGENQNQTRSTMAQQHPTMPTATANRPPVVPNNNVGATMVAVNPSAPFNRPPIDNADQAGFSIIRMGDALNISFTDIPTPIVIQSQRVGEDGNIKLPYNVTVKAAGKTPGQLQEDIRKEYVPRYFVNLTPTVKTDERVYFVGGEVRVPARQPYLADMTVLRAIDTAGGFTDFANRNKIELRRSNGKTYTVHWKKALEDPKQDLPVYPNDQVTVHKRRPLF
jgi:protein involved in polysaccharide export with SLBB domain